MSDREFTDITADVDALLADRTRWRSRPRANHSQGQIESGRTSLPKRQRRPSSRIATSSDTSNGSAGTGWDSIELDGTMITETSGRTGFIGTRRSGKGRGLGRS